MRAMLKSLPSQILNLANLLSARK